MAGRGEKPSARDGALRLLARREHSRRELAAKLAMRGHEPAEVEAAVAELACRKLQSDLRFAESLARRRAEAGYGPLRIQAELASHGLDRTAVGGVLDALGLDWCALAARVAARVPRRRDEDARDHAARVARHLSRRGFTGDMLRRLEGQGQEDPG